MSDKLKRENFDSDQEYMAACKAKARMDSTADLLRILRENKEQLDIKFPELSDEIKQFMAFLMWRERSMQELTAGHLWNDLIAYGREQVEV